MADKKKSLDLDDLDLVSGGVVQPVRQPVVTGNEWECSNCHTLNYETAKKCRHCSKEKE